MSLESSPKPQCEWGWLLWWEPAMHRTVKFITAWGRMVAHTRKQDLQATKKRLEEMRIFLKKTFLIPPCKKRLLRWSISLEVKRSMQLEELKCILGYRGFKMEMKPQSFTLISWRRILLPYRWLDFENLTGSLEEDLSQVKNTFVLHFQKKNSPYALSYRIVCAKIQCYKVIPYKVFLMERENLNAKINKDELLSSLNSTKEGKSLRLDGLPSEFFKRMWDIMGETCIRCLMKLSPKGNSQNSWSNSLI